MADQSKDITKAQLGEPLHLIGVAYSICEGFLQEQKDLQIAAFTKPGLPSRDDSSQQVGGVPFLAAQLVSVSSRQFSWQLSG